MSKTIAAIDIGSNSVRVVAGEIRDDRIALLARSSAQSSGVRNGYIINKSEASIAINKALRLTEKQVGKELQNVYVAAGSGPMQVSVVQAGVAVSHGDGIVTDVDIDNAVRRAVKKSLSSNQRNIDSIILNYKLDGVETVSEPLGMQGKKLEIETMLFNYASQNMDAIEDVLDSVHAHTQDFFPASIASSIVCLSAIDRRVGCILIDMGSDATSFVVYEHDAPVHVGYIPYGGDSITQAIALAYQISLADAEIFKQGGPLPKEITAKNLDEVINKALTYIFKQIVVELKKIDKHASLPGGAIICGGNALDRRVEEVARTILKIPSRRAVIRAFKREGDERELAWASCYGTLIQALEQNRLSVANPLSKLASRMWQITRRYFA